MPSRQARDASLPIVLRMSLSPKQFVQPSAPAEPRMQFVDGDFISWWVNPPFIRAANLNNQSLRLHTTEDTCRCVPFLLETKRYGSS
jgi:hypothetical protein